MARYMNEFLSLRSAPDILGTVGNLGNKPEKEISEAWAVIKKLRKIVLKEPDTYQLIDLCSGNALVPVIAAHLLPITNSIAVDKLPRKRNWSNARNFEYLEMDIKNIPYSTFTGKPTIITAVHCCRDKAETVINMFNEITWIKHMILMPCCIGSLNSPILRFIKDQANSDLAWVTKLAMMCKGKLNISKDNHCLSPKNYIIIAKKEK